MRCRRATTARSGDRERWSAETDVSGRLVLTIVIAVTGADALDVYIGYKWAPWSCSWSKVSC